MKKTIIVTTFLLTLTLFSCKGKRQSNETQTQTETSASSTDNGKNFEGTWQSEKLENLVYTITKVNSSTYTLSWRGWIDPATQEGGFAIPGEMHTGGNETLTVSCDNLTIMGMTLVAYVDENTLYITAGGEKGNCKRK
jgi:hypothetical protein